MPLNSRRNWVLFSNLPLSCGIITRGKTLPRTAGTAGAVATNGLSIGRKRDCSLSGLLLPPVAKETFFVTKGNGLPCKKCGTSAWYKRGACIECGKEQSRQRIKANPEAYREYHRQYRKRNPEITKRARKKWRAKNPDKVSANAMRWRKRHPETTRTIDKRYRGNNPQKVRERLRKRRAVAPEVFIAAKHRYRARKTEAGGSYTAAEWKALCAQYDNHCCYPGCERTDLHADHVIPISKGGTSNIDNIQPLCSSHNCSKGDKIIDYRYKPGLEHWQQSRLFQEKGT